VLERLAELDRAAFIAVNQGTRNAFFDWLMPWVTHEGKFKPFFVLLFVALLLFGKARGRTAALLVIPLIALSDQVSSNLLKDAIERVRPCNTLPDIHLLAGCSQSYSMPSSHAANTGAAVFHFVLFYPRLWAALLPVALLVAYSRVYVGVHYPADVLVGLLVGLAAAVTVQGGYRLGRAWRARRRTAAPAPAPPPPEVVAAGAPRRDSDSATR
jgi:undecaprenyl-diphosphatase